MNQTKHGVLTIANSTRYNTDDLLALFNSYEDGIVSCGQTPRLDAPHTSMVDVVDYKPGRIYADRNYWDVTEHRSVTTRVYQYVKPLSWSITSRNVVGLVPPDRLYDNPVEALTKIDSAFAPPLMVEQIMARLAGLYFYGSWDARRTTLEAMRGSIASGHLKLRIEEKRAPAKISDIRQRKARAAAFGSAKGISADFERIRTELGVLRAHLRGLNEQCERAGVEFTSDDEALCSVFPLLEDYRAKVDALTTQLSILTEEIS